MGEVLDSRELDALQLLQTLQARNPDIRVTSGVNEQNGRARFDLLVDGEWHQLYLIPVRFAERNCPNCYAKACGVGD